MNHYHHHSASRNRQRSLSRDRAWTDVVKGRARSEKDAKIHQRSRTPVRKPQSYPITAKMLQLLQHERDKINEAIRKANKSALGLLASASNDSLAQLWVHNTLEERTEIGRYIVRHLVVLLLPRNFHPERNKKRRVTRARALAETHTIDWTAVYVDAAKHQYRPHTYVVVVVRATDGKLLNACSVRGRSAEQAEESTIALALNGTPEVSTILSDSRMAIANLGHGSIGAPAASLLPRSKSTTTHLRWFPADVGATPGGAANRNERADAVARELVHRAAPPRPSDAEEAEPPDSDRPLDYGSILQWYRESHRALQGPHPRLGRREGVLLIQLQTSMVLTPALPRHVCRGL
ncbi:hypothetical protein HPB51_004728 [Rhipicephalus microplus]|uniref:Tick transposon n=1 Tax=Rhipicephalus microplus TaxID=6941 RepID=A0A9J6EFB0_RHIMP|nr:hypothetical protein HPB51_004728 [Rhipicephalus microplus]